MINLRFIVRDDGSGKPTKVLQWCKWTIVDDYGWSDWGKWEDVPTVFSEGIMNDHAKPTYEELEKEIVRLNNMIGIP